MARLIPLRFFQSLLVLGVLLGASAVRSPSLLAQATATLQATARVVSTTTPQAGQANGLLLAQETLQAAKRGFEAGRELRRELNGAALVSRMVIGDTPLADRVSDRSNAASSERRIQVTVHYAAN